MVFSGPYHVEIEATLRCPLRCVHCSLKAGEKKTDLLRESYIELLENCSKLRVKIFDVIGGEPLIRPDIYELLESAVRKIPNVIVNTSGFFINKKVVKKLKKTGIKNIFVSIDGPSPEKHEIIRGSGKKLFQKTCNGIKLLIKEGFNVTVAFVVNKVTFKDVPQMIELCSLLGVKNLFILGFIPIGRGANQKNLIITENMLMETLKDLRKYSNNKKVNLQVDCSMDCAFYELEGDICPAGANFITITVNGDVFPCGFLRENPEFKLGNIKEKRFFDIWMNFKKKKLINFNQMLRNWYSQFSDTKFKNICLARILYNFRNKNSDSQIIRSFPP